jgi:hypothetical protein
MNTPTQWTIEERLVDEIDRARIHNERFVILESLPYYAQMIPNIRMIYGEVISNNYLGGMHRLSPEQESRLMDLGWSPPDTRCHPDCESDHHPNYSMTWPSTTLSTHIAREILRGLTVAMAKDGEGAAPMRVRSDARAFAPTHGWAPGH